VDTFGTSTLTDAQVVEIIRDHFPLTPKGIIDYLKLRRPIFKDTARHGHFGRKHPDLTWEKTDKVETLKKAASQCKCRA
jgi:S-adenosylmethionine synthetase